MPKTALVAGTAVTALIALAGCSSSDSATQSTPAASASAQPSESLMSPASAPVMVEPGQTDVTAAVGQTIVFNVGAKPGRWDITTDNSSVLQVQPGGKQGSATFNPGAQALSAGTATVTLTDKKSSLDAMEYTVTITQ